MSEQSKHLQPKNVVQSVQMLRYRGVFYLREKRSPNLSLTSAKVEHLLNDSTQKISQRNCVIPNEPMGYLYKLYCIGWKNGSLQCFSVLQHWLLSIFVYYRRGYNQGLQWRQQHRLTSLADISKLVFSTSAENRAFGINTLSIEAKPVPEPDSSVVTILGAIWLGLIAIRGAGFKLLAIKSKGKT